MQKTCVKITELDGLFGSMVPLIWQKLDTLELGNATPSSIATFRDIFPRVVFTHG